MPSRFEGPSTLLLDPSTLLPSFLRKQESIPRRHTAGTIG